MAFSLYRWQQQCINAWLSGGRRGIIEVATGAGKTVTALFAAKALQETLDRRLHLLIIVPKTFLLGQWKQMILTLEHELGYKRDEIGLVGGGVRQEHNKPVMIYVVNSARYRVSSLVAAQLKSGQPVMLIADECHHYGSEENRKIFSFLSVLDDSATANYYALGLSATPHTFHFDSVLVPALGPLFYSYDVGQAIADGVVNDVVIYNIGLWMDSEQAEEYEKLTDAIINTFRKMPSTCPELVKVPQGRLFGELQRLAHGKDETKRSFAMLLLTLLYKRRSLVYEAPQRIDCAFDLISLLSEESTIIIFAERIEQSEALYEALSGQMGNTVAMYHSQMGDVARTLALRRYRMKEVRILVSCKALDEGLDIPSADVGIVIASTSEQRQRIQRLGRILRKDEGKGTASLFYFSLLDTVEDTTLLSDERGEIEEMHLTWDGNFSHPAYDELAYALLYRVEERGLGIENILGFIDQGRIRSDWRLKPHALLSLQQNAESPEHSAYYSVMRSLAMIRESGMTVA
ncbi:MAG: DEAD/DEAH box helicase [Sphaerochaeta sp.]|jgi:superfamily II DNA or RNA helicase|nr:DEAD/DEAH box helicase [Sphaerochaeta sp.]MDX9915819.1 DEAD/DEAH box helicase [Sphaerochaeta sp.]